MHSYREDIQLMESLGHRVVKHPQRVPRSRFRRIRAWRRRRAARPATPWDTYEDIGWRCSACGQVISRTDLLSPRPDRCPAPTTNDRRADTTR